MSEELEKVAEMFEYLENNEHEEKVTTHHEIKPTPKCPFKDRPCDKQCRAYAPELNIHCHVLAALYKLAGTV